MENKFYYYISNNSSLGVIKKGTGVSTNKDNAIINYIVYGDSKNKTSELLITNENGTIKYEISKNSMDKLEENSNNCYLYLIRKEESLVDKNMILTKDSSVVQRIEITDIIDEIKKVVDINESMSDTPIKIKKESKQKNVSTIELLFYAKKRLLSLKEDIKKRAKTTKPKEVKLTDVYYVYDDEEDYDLEEELYEREYIKIKNNKAS